LAVELGHVGAMSYMKRSLLSALSSEDPRATLEYALAHRGTSGVDGLLVQPEIPWKRWKDKDPQAAAQWLIECDDPSVQYMILDSFWPGSFKGMSTEQVLALVDCIPPRERSGNLWETVIRKLQKEDFPVLLNLLNEEGEGAAFEKFRTYLRRVTAEKMDLAAATFISRRRQYFLVTMFEKWMKQDADAAIQWAQDQDGTSFYPRISEQVTQYLVNSAHNAEAVVQLDSVNNPSLRKECIRLITLDKAKVSASNALSWIRDELSQPEDQKNAARSFLYAYEGDNPQDIFAAVSLATSMHASSAYTHLKRFDSEKLMASIRGMPEASRKVLDSVLYTLARNDIERAFELMSDPSVMGREKGQVESTQAMVAEVWARSDFRSAMNWAVGLSVEGEENQVLKAVLGEVAGESMVNLAMETISLMPPGPTKDSALLYAIRKMHSANGGYKEVADWVSRQGGEDIQAAAYTEIAGRWITSDVMAASKWIDELPDGEVRDGCVHKLITNLSQKSPEEAYPWAFSMSSPKDRQQQLQRVIHSWKRVDFEAAHRAVALETRLSQEDKEQLLRVFK
ncbi:MAG: hypothetical protein ACPGSB_04210, partial [Opitutales bacterium]